MLRLSSLLYDRAKGKLILIVFAIIVLFMAITLPLLSRIYPAGDEMVSLDDPVFYTPDEIFSIMEDWGNSGRTYQLWLHLTWDFIFPIMGFVFIGLFTSWLLQRSFRPDSKLRRLNLITLGSAFDLLENCCIIYLIAAYPVKPVAAAWLKTISTMCKYGFAVLILLLILVGLIKATINKLSARSYERKGE